MKYFEVSTNVVTGEQTIRPYTEEEIAVCLQNELDGARIQRDNLLSTVVDPLVSNPLRWAELTTEQQQAWIDYRRALLDVPQQAGFPSDVAWPTQPLGV